MSETSLPLPPDRERLHVIREYLEQLRAGHQVIGTFLQVLTEAVDRQLAAASPTGPPDSYRLQKMRVPEGRAMLHREDCWVKGGGVLSRDEALLALADTRLQGLLETCQACHPEEHLGNT